MPNELLKRIEACDRELMEYRALGSIKNVIRVMEKVNRLEENAKKEIRQELEHYLRSQISKIKKELEHPDFEDDEHSNGCLAAYEDILAMITSSSDDPQPEHKRKLSIPDERD